MREVLRTALHVVSENLGNPAIILVIIAIIISVFLIGEVIGEYFVTRFRKKLDVRDLLIDLDGTESAEDHRRVFGLYKLHAVQREAFDKVLSLPTDVTAETRRTVAVQAVMDAEMRTDRMLLLTKIGTRIGPMLGLMGTLIPLGPGLAALGEGDPKALSDAMLMAFDTTVAGLTSGLVAFVVYEIKRSWYTGDVNAVETILEEVTQQ
jgi:biopolymer transport protein ExbB/TolQ